MANEPNQTAVRRRPEPEKFDVDESAPELDAELLGLVEVLVNYWTTGGDRALMDQDV